MKTSPHGIAFIAAHEGVVTRTYRDVAGVWTIGVGHTAAAGPPAPKAGMTLTRQAALDLLAADLPRYEGDVDVALGKVAQTAFDGAVSFHFNTGAIRRATWVRRFRAGAADAAEASLKQWRKARGRVYAGLVRRRAEEADLIFRGAYPPSVATGDVRDPFDDPALRRKVAGGLAELGYLNGPDATGEALVASVKRFQAEHDLVVDGIAGPATQSTLTRAIAARRAGGIVAGSGGAGAAGGAAGTGAPADPATGFGDVVVAALGWGAAAAIAATLVFLACRYRGVLAARLRFGIFHR